MATESSRELKRKQNILTGKHNVNPRGADHEFETGDLVTLDRVTWGIPHLENKTGTVLSQKQAIPFEDDQTISVYAVEIDGSKEVALVYAPEMTLRPENDRHAIGRKASVVDASNGISAGTYVSAPRVNESGTFQAVQLDDGSYVVDQTK